MTQRSISEPRVFALVNDLLFASRIEGTLSALGYMVRSVPATVEAADLAREWRPDVVVVSFGVPFSDWEGALRAIRATPELGAVPVLAFGPHVDTAGRATALAAGATRVITNGAFFNRMPDIVAAVLEGSRQRAADSEQY
jgi:CheY-like chemotaxis protein